MLSKNSFVLGSVITGGTIIGMILIVICLMMIMPDEASYISFMIRMRFFFILATSALSSLLVGYWYAKRYKEMIPSKLSTQTALIFLGEMLIVARAFGWTMGTSSSSETWGELFKVVFVGFIMLLPLLIVNFFVIKKFLRSGSELMQ